MNALRLSLFAAVLAANAALRVGAEPLTLQDAHATALRNHPQAAIGKLRELVAQEALKQSQAAYFPTANAFFNAVRAGNENTRILAGALNNPVIYDRVADGMGISELITDFGQTSNLVASARLSARAESENAEATNQQILLSVDANYFSALQAQAVLEVAKQTVDARRLLVTQITALAKNQLKSELDVSFAEVALEQALLLQQKAEGDAAGSQAGLSAALGYREIRLFKLADVPAPLPPPADIDGLIDAAWNHRPDLLRLRYERDAAARFARAEKDQNYPTVAAVGTFGNAINHDDRLPNKYAAGGIAVDIPLFAGGAYLARQHEAELKAKIAEQAVRDQEDSVGRDVRMAWVNFNTSVQRYRTTEELLKHATQALALAQARYNIGSGSIVELSDAQVNATSAQIAEANARYDESIQEAILNYQVGALK